MIVAAAGVRMPNIAARLIKWWRDHNDWNLCPYVATLVEAAQIYVSYLLYRCAKYTKHGFAQQKEWKASALEKCSGEKRVAKRKKKKKKIIIKKRGQLCVTFWIDSIGRNAPFMYSCRINQSETDRPTHNWKHNSADGGNIFLLLYILDHIL